MDARLLELQQYIQAHPLLKKSTKIKKKYLSLLTYFVSSFGEGDLWAEQMLKLYVSKSDVNEVNDKPEDLSFFQRFKFSKYREILLSDCLFMTSFYNREKGKQLLECFINYFGNRYRERLAGLYDIFYGDIIMPENYFATDVEKIYKLIQENRKFSKKTEKRIMITANMSAGKSTLLNALVGKKVNKTQNAACTAKTHYLYNKAGEDGFIYEWDHNLELDATRDILMDDNNENESIEIHVGARFRSQGDINARVCFIDTPGVNSAMNEEHKDISYETLKKTKCDLLIYLFNGENIGSEDDRRHLEFVRENYTGNILFLVNRMDKYKEGEDSVLQTLAGVRAELEGIGFEEPDVYPISAYAGYLAKTVLYGETLNDDEIDSLDLFVRKFKKSSFFYEKYYPTRIQVSDETNEVEILLVHSGITSLEKIIFN